MVCIDIVVSICLAAQRCYRKLSVISYDIEVGYLLAYPYDKGVHHLREVALLYTLF